MSVQAFDRLATVLAEIRPRFGAGAFSDRRRVIGLLADKAPDAKREIRVVGTAIDEGIPAALARTERHLVGVEMDRLANALEASTGLRLDIARQVVRAFGFAMDLGPLPSIYEAAGMPAPVAAPPPAPVAPPAGGWSGMTAPVQPTSQPTTAPPISQYPPISQPTQPYHPGGTQPMGFASVPTAGKPNMAGRIALGVGGLVVLALGVSQFMGPGPRPGPTNNVIVSGETGFAGELVDQGIAAQSELNANLGSPTPLSIPVGQRVTTTELQRMIQSDPQVILVDVLAQPHEQTIQGAYWLPSGGSAGTFQDSYQSDFAAGLGQVTGGEQSRPVVFFCAGANCWESYNAALRANAAGFTRLFWYRGGLAAWAEARLPMAPLPTQGQAQPVDPQQQPVDPQQQQPVDPNGPPIEPDPSVPPGDKVPTQ